MVTPPVSDYKARQADLRAAFARALSGSLGAPIDLGAVPQDIFHQDGWRNFKDVFPKTSAFFVQSIVGLTVAGIALVVLDALKFEPIDRLVFVVGTSLSPIGDIIPAVRHDGPVVQSVGAANALYALNYSAISWLLFVLVTLSYMLRFLTEAGASLRVFAALHYRDVARAPLFIPSLLVSSFGTAGLLWLIFWSSVYPQEYGDLRIPIQFSAGVNFQLLFWRILLVIALNPCTFVFVVAVWLTWLCTCVHFLETCVAVVRRRFR